jgi:hypothetical protein
LTPPLSAAPLNLLFFGNSFTLYNNMPSMVAKIAAADGHAAPNVFVHGEYGWTLDDQLYKLARDGPSNIISRALPSGQMWDYVVIQELSTRPSTIGGPPIFGDAAGFRRDAVELLRLVRARSPGVRAVLQETWARGYGNPVAYPRAYPTPAAMQDDLFAQYHAAANDAIAAFGPGAAAVSPTGEGWRALDWRRDLYDGDDEYHPSPRGSLLAALVVERAIYHSRTTSIPAASVPALLSSTGLTAADWGRLTAVADAL